jgi:flavin-dependent dehydrogenase
MAFGIASPEVVSLWPAPSRHGRPAIIDPYGPAWHVERGAFRSSLAAVAGEAGVSLFSEGRVHATAQRRGWQLTCGAQTIDAPFLIVASGRHGLPIRSNVAHRSVDRLVAVVGRCEQGRGGPESRLIIEAGPDGWWYRCPGSDGFQQVAFLSDVDLVRATSRADSNWFARSLAQTDVGQELSVCALQTFAADTYYRDAVVGRDVVLIGDAAMAGDPLAGDGVTWAVTSALRAADIVLSCSEEREAALEQYSEAVATRFMQFMQARSETYGRVTQWSNFLFWARRTRFVQVDLPPRPSEAYVDWQ